MAHLYELTNLFENQAKQDIGMYRGIVLEGAESKPEPSVHAITEQAAANHSQNDPIEILEGLLDEMERGEEMIDRQSLAYLRVGSKIKFAEEVQRYTVRARSENFLVCTKPFNARKTVLYTVIDIERNIRGTENLILPSGAETDEQCDEMIARLTSKDPDCFQTEVSYRNNIPLRILEVLI